MKKYKLDTIQQGRLNDLNMNKIVGGDVYCPIHSVTSCVTATGIYTTCSGGYENCSSLGYDSCSPTYAVCWGWGK